MRAVVASIAVWILARFAFWIGYHRSAAMRGLGAPGMALSMIMLLYVAGRIGYDAAGAVGAAVPLVTFFAIEAYLFRVTRPAAMSSHGRQFKNSEPPKLHSRPT